MRNDKWHKEKIKVNGKLEKLYNFPVMLYVRGFYILDDAETYIVNTKVCTKQETWANKTTKE